MTIGNLMKMMKKIMSMKMTIIFEMIFNNEMSKPEIINIMKKILINKRSNMKMKEERKRKQ